MFGIQLLSVMNPQQWMMHILLQPQSRTIRMNDLDTSKQKHYKYIYINKAISVITKRSDSANP